MDSIKNSANFELSFIYFCEQYAWFNRTLKTEPPLDEIS